MESAFSCGTNIEPFAKNKTIELFDVSGLLYLLERHAGLATRRANLAKSGVAANGAGRDVNGTVNRSCDFGGSMETEFQPKNEITKNQIGEKL